MNLFSPPTVTFCEAIGDGLIARPYLAFSNLAFYVAAFYILARLKDSKVAKQFALLIIIIGSFSLIYDIKPIYLTQLLDLFGMLVIVNFLIYQDLLRWLPHKRKLIMLIQAFALLSSFGTIVYFKGFAGDIVFGAFVLSEIVIQGVVFHKKLAKYYKYWMLGFLALALGFLLWIPDATKSFCSSVLIFNGRALFHYFVATTLCLLALFYSRNEDKIIKSK